MSPGKDHDSPIRGDILRQAFEQLNVLGQAFKDLMIERLEEDGMVFDARHSYSLKEIDKSLSAVFGKDATALIIKKIKRGLDLAG